MAIIRPEDLSLKGIAARLPAHLPRRDLQGLEPLVAALEEMAAEHRERTAEERARQKPPHQGTNIRARGSPGWAGGGT